MDFRSFFKYRNGGQAFNRMIYIMVEVEAIYW